MLKDLLELLNWFRAHGISRHPGKGLDKVVAFQDIIGRQSIGQIAEMFERLTPGEQDTFFFAVWSALDFSLAKEITWNCYARPRHEKVVNAVRGALGDHIRSLEKEIVHLKAALNELRRGHLA